MFSVLYAYFVLFLFLYEHHDGGSAWMNLVMFTWVRLEFYKKKKN